MQQFNLKLQQAIVELQQNNLKSNLRKWKINIKIMLEEFKVQLPVFDDETIAEKYLFVHVIEEI